MMPRRKPAKAKTSENPMDDSHLMQPFRDEQYDEETRLAMNDNLDALGESLGLDEEDFGTVPSEPSIKPPEFNDDTLGNEEDLTTGSQAAER